MYTNAGCSRLVDYYFVVSCDARGMNHIKTKLRNESLAPPNEQTARHAQFALKPKIIDRYPEDNHSDTPLMPWVARTSMPRGIRARTRPPPPTFFTFVGWNIDTSKLYGACLMVFEKIHIKNQLQTVYVPKTLGFVSHYPYFCAFDVFLRCLWHVIPKKLIPLENLLMHYFTDIPAPAPSRKIAYDLGQMQVLLACRNEFDVPILELPMETAFTQLSKDRICFILKLLLLEKRIIFICGDMHQLTPVCELFVSLLFPLRWRHLYMPLLSHTMFQALMNKFNPNNKPRLNKYTTTNTTASSVSHIAPHGYRYRDDAPFIVGLPRFVYLNPEIQNNMPINSFLVFLDRNEITDYKKNAIDPNNMKSGRIVPNLPSPLENTLRDAIHTLARILTMQVDGIDRQGQQTPHQTPLSRSNVHAHTHTHSHSHGHAQQQQHQYQHIKGSSSGSQQKMGALHQMKRGTPAGVSDTSLYSSSSQTSTSSSTVMGGHNAMFISREYTLQAFRTMFAVMTKLLYLAAHKEYGQSMDNHSHTHVHEDNSNKQAKVDKYSKQQFIIKFRVTQLFQSFYKYYKRINGEDDPYFKRMYLYYKGKEGHGKHFARRQPNHWEGHEPFDRKLYDREIFKISKDKIKTLESHNGKNNGNNKVKHMHEIAAKRAAKYFYPTAEFAMLSEVREFLKMYVWKDTKHHHSRHHSRHSQSTFSNSPKTGSRYTTSRRQSRASSTRSSKRHRKKKSVVDNQNVNIKGVVATIQEEVDDGAPPTPPSRKRKHKRTHSRSSHKSIRKKHRKHILNNSNSLDVSDMALQSKIELFCTDLTHNKDMEGALSLCLEIEKKIRKQIAKNNEVNRMNAKNVQDVGSIDGAASQIGFKLNEKNKGADHWKRAIYEIFKEDIQGKHNLVTMIGKIVGVYPQHKKELKLLRGVVDLFDDELSLASVSVRSLFLHRNAKSTTSKSTTSTSTTTSSSSWGDDTVVSEESDTVKKKKPKQHNDTDSEDESESESDSESDSESGTDSGSESGTGSCSDSESGSSGSSTSSGWSRYSEDIGAEEKEKDRLTSIGGHGKFTKLDEFTLDPQESQWFDKCEKLHNDSLGVEGVKYMKSLVLIGADCMDDYIVQKWLKHYKLKLKNKANGAKKPILAQNPPLAQLKSTDVAPFNINHSYNAYKSSADIKNPYHGYGGKASFSKYKKPPLPPRSSSTRSPASKSPRGAPRLPMRETSSSKRKRSPRPPPKANAKSPLALNISPKSSHSSKYYQHIIMHYPNNNKKHYHNGHHSNNGSHNNGSHSSNRKKKKQNDHSNDDVYVD